MKDVVNCHDVEKIKLIDLNADCFDYLKQTDFLLIQLLVDVLSADINDMKLNLVFLLKNYKLVILIVVVNLTELSSDNVIVDKIVEINHFLDV